MHKVGVDILHIPRLAKILSKSYGSALPRRILSHLEQSEYAALSPASRIPYLSTRWALKEAAWKASQPFVSSWKDCTVQYNKAGAPHLIVSDDVPLEFECSVSHDGEYCVAYVVTTKRAPPPKKDKRGTEEMISEYERDFPRKHDAAEEWVNKW